MNIASFSFTELVLMLRASCPIFERRVGGAAEFLANTTPDAQFKVPYIFCLPLAQQGGDINQSRATQDRNEIVAIIVCLDNEDQGGVAQGKASVRRVDAVSQLQVEIEKACYKWKPTTFHLMNPPKFLQRVPMGMTNTRLWFQLEFQFDFQVHCNYFAGMEIGEWADQDPQPITADKIRTIAIKYNASEEEVRSLEDGMFAPPYAEQGTDAGDPARATFEGESLVVGISEEGEATITAANMVGPVSSAPVNHGAQIELTDGGGI